MSTFKIGLIGEVQDIQAFNALGMDLFPIEDPDEVGELLRRLVRTREYGIILITETVGEAVRGTVEEFANQPLPSIAFIPGSQGSRGFARERLRRMVERAVGVDILGKTVEDGKKT